MLDTVFDEKANAFRFDPRLRLAAFPIEGIHTRVLHVGDEGPNPVFIETSSPGLKGQSGGPIFDVEGYVWAIQSQTHHYDLGFDPKSPDGKVERQFLNAGLGTHPARILEFLDKHNVSHRVQK